MKVDIGFWDSQGEYIPDIQEVSEVEMDKEIIIDGVGCVFYNNGKCENPNGMSCNCINNAICYYKELKRLEQENAELKAENKRLKALLDVLEEDNKKLSKENDVFYNNSLQEVKEDLVKRVWNLQKQYAEVINQFEIESLTDKTTGETIYRSNVVNKLKELLELRIEDLCESCGASSMMPMPCTVYKQTLQEIKGVVSKIIDGYIRPYGDYNQLEQILDLITKAEEE